MFKKLPQFSSSCLVLLSHALRGCVVQKKPIKPLSCELLRVSVAEGDEVRALIFLNALKMYLLLLDICQLLITAGNLVFS